ncbi:Vps52/Sac2 [Lasallia pustulata]|uniref:Vps52/Sac2 n=1 Tax=Lasallia pustulata TaxID=136370 RepID=A0A1W5CVQ1_9LECA|nr:Vps52/Sac2 [Lasallia pustulata]
MLSSVMLNSRSRNVNEKEKDRFEDLHRSILACDEVLKSVEISLTSFQRDLGAVSAEIETLQSRSSILNTKLENRKTVEKLLGPAVEEISISPAVVQKISEGVIDEVWVKALDEVEKRSKLIDGKLRGTEPTRAAADIKPLLENLTSKALERIRDFFVAQVKALRSPSINAQIIQHQGFLQYKDLYVFLNKHHPQLAGEMSQAYINTMRWYYLDHFTRYRAALQKLSLYNVDKHDILGADPPSQRAHTAQRSHDALNLGRRIEVLKGSSHSAITSYLAEEDKTTHYLETPFRNFNLALIDNASAEYSFLTDFFSPNSYHQVSQRFASIFEPTFSLGRTLTKELIESTYDCLGVLLCVRLNQHSAFELQRRKIPAADGYINATNMLLWPRFQVAMDAHCDSVRRLTSTLSTRSAASALSLTDSSKQPTAPHQLTQRFGQFAQGVLALSSEAGDDEPVAGSLARLRAEFEAFLAKLGKGIADKKKRERFLANNYSLVLTIIGDVGGKLAGEQREHFEELRKACGGDR